MTTAIVDQPSPTRLRPPSVVRPARRRASDRGPLARPVRPAAIPPPLANGVVRACRVDPATRPSGPWRLTDRGIALVLILTAMIVMAAVTVIGLTAWRVTGPGPGYQATGVIQLSQR
jgi:hypothetical protein